MKNRKLKSLVIITLMLFSFVSMIQAQAQILPRDKYIFFELFTMVSGTSEDEMMFIDFPMYHFNADQKTLNYQTTLELSDTTQIIYGSGLGLSGSVGSGASTGLKCYDNLSVADLFEADTNGTVRFNLEGNWITLVPGQQIEETIQTNAYRGFRGELIVTHRIHNLGIWDKSGIYAPNITPIPQLTPTPLILGDVSGDGVINIVDALMVAQYYVGVIFENFHVEAGDVNKSGRIDIIDALLIAQYYIGLIDAFPVSVEQAFKVTEFTSQKWYGGVAGSGGGTDYKGRLSVLAVRIDSVRGIWIDNRYYQPGVKNLTNPDSTVLSRGDEVEITCKYRWTPNIPEIGILPKEEPPKEEPPKEEGPEYNGGALIIYTIDGQEKSFIVDRIKELDSIYYP
ncbi:MAG: dockerin type I repeat-containing protein [Spirochaetales bacterium]|nr:dockerin type I repeat-containing protein [Spirochaetales bacterium]